MPRYTSSFNRNVDYEAREDLHEKIEAMLGRVDAVHGEAREAIWDTVRERGITKGRAILAALEREFPNQSQEMVDFRSPEGQARIEAYMREIMDTARSELLYNAMVYEEDHGITPTEDWETQIDTALKAEGPPAVDDPSKPAESDD